MTEPIVFFEKYLGASTHREGLVIAAFIDRLPQRFQAIAPNDLEQIVSTCIYRLRDALDHFHSREVQQQIEQELRRTLKLARELQAVLARNSGWFQTKGVSFDSYWRHISEGGARTFAVNNVLHPRIGFPEEKQSDFGKAAAAVQNVSEVADTFLKVRRRSVYAHRPKREILKSVLYPLVGTWSCLEILCGARVAKSLPNARNGGFRWCADAVGMVPQYEFFEDNELGIRSDVTIKDSLSTMRKVFVSELSKVPFLEPEAKWGDLGWDSLVGLEILTRAARPAGLDQIVVESDNIDRFRSLWSQMPSDWNPQVQPFVDD